MLDSPKQQGPLDRPIDLTFFKDRNASVKRDASMSLRALASRILNRNAPSKEDLPWLKLATFGNRVTDRGSLRNNDNVLSATGVELDYDKGAIPLSEAGELLEKAGVACLLYTSPSHKPEFPKWRILAPFSEAMDGPARAHMAGRIAGLFYARYGANVFDAASWTLSQSFFYGFVANDEPFHHKTLLVDGEEVDLHDKLDETAVGRPNTTPRHNDAGMRATDTSERQPLDLGMAEESILTGDNFHSSLLSIAGHLVARGMDADEIYEQLDGLMQAVPVEVRRANQRRWKQRSSEKHLHGVIAYCLERERKTHRFRDYERSGDQPAEDKPEPEPEEEDDGEKVEPAQIYDLLSPFRRKAEEIPQRPWLIPGLAMTGHLTLVIAPGAVGKSTFTTHLALMCASGQPWAHWRPRRRMRVLVINLEDPIEEMERRFHACAMAMGLQPGDVIDHIAMPKIESLVFARLSPLTKAVSPTPSPVYAKLKATIVAGGYDLVSVDPFLETHEANENDNTSIKTVAGLWRRLARETNIAIILVHHARKGNMSDASEMDMTRGASSLASMARCGVLMATMSKDEASLLGVEEDQRRQYVSIYEGLKANYTPQPTGLAWFQREGRQLGNGKGFDAGDNVGVMVPWDAPAATGDLDISELNAALADIDKGILNEDGSPSGIRYTKARQGNHWVGKTLLKRDVAEAHAKNLIAAWFKNEVLFEASYTHPKYRRPADGVYVNHAARPGAKS